MTPPPLAQTRDTWLFWLLLGLIALAEWLTAAVDAWWGLGLHLLILVVLILYAALGPSLAARQLAAALTLAPLIRLLSVTMPLPLLPQLAWYPAVSLPILISAWLIIRHTGLRPADLAMRRGSALIGSCVVLSSLALGGVEYVILSPEQLVPVSWSGILMAAVVLTIFTGFSEELIFRGVLQTLGLRVFGSAALIYVSLLFGALHIGYLSFIDMVFVSAVGLLYAVAVRHGASLLSVSVSHGLTNLSLFVLAPAYVAGGLAPWAQTLAVVLLAAGGLGLAGLLGLLIGALLGLRRPSPGGDLPLTQLAGGD